MLVIAKKGTKCPKERNPRQYIEDSFPVDVPGTAYYRRRLADGSLGLVLTPAQAKQAIEQVSEPVIIPQPKKRKAE